MGKLQYLQGLHTVSGIYVPAHAAATATEKLPVFEAPFDCYLRRVAFAPQAAVTGQDTNTTHINVLDGGAAGSGTTELATKELVNGTDLAALDYQDIFALTDTKVELSAGDIVLLQEEKVGTGLAVGQGFVLVSVEAKGS
jgi:hypothetical protein